VVRGAQPLRLRVLPLALPDPGEDALRPRGGWLPGKPVAATVPQPQQRATRRSHRARVRGTLSQRQTTVDDAVIDLSDPEAERWYKGKLARLLEMGAGIFTADFGEAAPLSGLYASGQASFLEHNLYPLRYNKAVSEATEEASGHGTIYARSAWAGSQRYPIHWSGDAETTDAAMAATLRAGLSLGLCGFCFWSHFIGGFAYPSPPELYLRWLAFGVLTSHSRCHGMPPTEPWEYGEEFTKEFRRIVEMRYRLMPYIYAQARLCSESGYPMLRTLFFEYPEDPTCWTVEDQYMFGEDILVAPLMEETQSRNVYLPPGFWVDYQVGRTYEGARGTTSAQGRSLRWCLSVTAR
jgi:alpha-D-xyloside xylohydrolase